jgi:hypothetical protein
MKLLMTICAALAMVVMMAPTSQATDFQYGWTISNSIASPFSNTGPFVPGLGTLYIWYECSVKDGMSAAEMAFLTLNAANVTLAFTPLNGFLNAGTTTEWLLAVGSCPAGPVVAGQMLCLMNAPGEFCIVPSAANGINVTVDCSPNPQTHTNSTVGFAHDGAVLLCNDLSPELCNVVSVDQTSWGQVKGLYR